MTIEIALLLSVVSVGFSIYFGAKSAKHTDTKDIERQVADTTRLNTKLDMIQSDTQEIKSDVRTMSQKLEEHGREIVVLDQSLKTAHKRIDGLEERLMMAGGEVHER